MTAMMMIIISTITIIKICIDCCRLNNNNDDYIGEEKIWKHRPIKNSNKLKLKKVFILKENLVVCDIYAVHQRISVPRVGRLITRLLCNAL
jgi:hypothetical protein